VAEWIHLAREEISTATFSFAGVGVPFRHGLIFGLPLLDQPYELIADLDIMICLSVLPWRK